MSETAKTILFVVLFLKNAKLQGGKGALPYSITLRQLQTCF